MSKSQTGPVLMLNVCDLVTTWSQTYRGRVCVSRSLPALPLMDETSRSGRPAPWHSDTERVLIGD